MATAIETAVLIETILLQSSVPELLLARDVVDTLYLCVLTDADDRGHHFIAVQISDARLAKFRTGGIDLRAILTEPERPLRFAGWLPPGDEKLIELGPADTFKEAWLPEEGFFLNAFEDEVSADNTVADAMARNAAVIVAGLNPPEARGAHPTINADRLADCLNAFQSLVKRATTAVIRTLPEASRGNYAEDAHVLQVFGFSYSSFNVHLSAKDRPDLFGATVVGDAMTLIDSLMGLTEKSPDEALAGLKQQKGLVLAAYEDLMKFVSEQESSFAYRWSEPARSVAFGHSVTPVAAKAMVQILDSKETEKTEPFTFTGRFTSVNTEVTPRSWRARDLELKPRRGVLHENSFDILDGATIRTEQYTFFCEERLVKPISGRSQPKLFLKSLKKS